MNINEKLAHSIRNQNLESVKECLKNGADANAKDAYGWSALETASYNDSLEIVKLLIDNGAEVNGKALVNSALLSWTDNENKNKIEIAKLLIEKGADVNARNNDGETAFILAIKDGKADIPFQKLLIENGADVHIKDNNGLSALDYANKVIEAIKEKVKPNREKYNKSLKAKQKVKSNDFERGM